MQGLYGIEMQLDPSFEKFRVCIERMYCTRIF